MNLWNFKYHKWIQWFFSPKKQLNEGAKRHTSGGSGGTNKQWDRQAELKVQRSIRLQQPARFSPQGLSLSSPSSNATAFAVYFWIPLYTYLLAPPTRKRAAARPFPRRSQGLKASRTFPVLRFSTGKVLFSACARGWKRLVVMRGDKERCSLSSGRHCKEFLGTLHIWCELCPRWPLLPSERTTGKPQWKSSTCASV